MTHVANRKSTPSVQKNLCLLHKAEDRRISLLALLRLKPSGFQRFACFPQRENSRFPDPFPGSNLTAKQKDPFGFFVLRRIGDSPATVGSSVTHLGLGTASRSALLSTYRSGVRISTHDKQLSYLSSAVFHCAQNCGA